MRSHHSHLIHWSALLLGTPSTSHHVPHHQTRGDPFASAGAQCGWPVAECGRAKNRARDRTVPRGPRLVGSPGESRSGQPWSDACPQGRQSPISSRLAATFPGPGEGIEEQHPANGVSHPSSHGVAGATSRRRPFDRRGPRTSIHRITEAIECALARMLRCAPNSAREAQERVDGGLPGTCFASANGQWL
jgi:hypothetical protein